VSISALVTNTGDLTDTYQVSLTLDGILLQTREITLNGGDSETVAFSANPETAGIHQISIGDVVESITVIQPQAPTSTSQPQAPNSAFATSEISVTPTEVYQGESVEISILVSNTSELAGSYEVILKIDNEVVQSREITLDSGISDIVSFSVTAETTGGHIITIGDKLAVFNVESGVPVTGVKYNTGPKINYFNVTPIFDTETSQLMSTRIDYQINKSEELQPGDELVLSIYCEGQPLDELQILTLSQLKANGDTGSLSYIPSQGWWGPGTYIFQAELRSSDGYVQSTQMEKFRLATESMIRTFSWGSFGIIIGATLIMVTAAVALYIVYRRRDILIGYGFDPQFNLVKGIKRAIEAFRVSPANTKK